MIIKSNLKGSMAAKKKNRYGINNGTNKKKLFNGSKTELNMKIQQYFTNSIQILQIYTLCLTWLLLFLKEKLQ